MDRQVSEITARQDGPPTKRPRWKNDYSPWSVDVAYRCEDGRVVETVQRFGLKRDAAAFLATLPARPAHRLVCHFDEAGTFTGTAESFWIGPRDMDTYAAGGAS
jgi:hypothetical protein